MSIIIVDKKVVKLDSPATFPDILQVSTERLFRLAQEFWERGDKIMAIKLLRLVCKENESDSSLFWLKEAKEFCENNF